MIKNKYPTTKPSLNLDFANTKSLDPRITFRRGTPGTYYDGVTHVKAEENLLSYSEDFTDSSWLKLGTALETTTEIAPDGSQNAYFLKQNSANSQHAIYARDLADLGKTYSISIYAKAGAVSRILLGSVFTNESVLYDLSSGEFERYTYSSKLIKSYNMESAGNGWYRCSIVYESATSDNGMGLYLLDDNDGVAFVGDSSSGLYIWGAQLEQRDSVTAYTSTMREDGTSAPITKYQPKLMTAAADTARFDHDPLTGESKGLLIEEQRTNLIPYSEDFDDDYWTHPRADVYEHVIAPDGTRSAAELVANTSASGGMSIYKQTVTTISSPFTVSCYFKKGDNNYAAIFNNDGVGSGANQYFDIFNGAVESGTTFGSVSFTIDDASIQDVGNGWFRCSVTITTDATSVRSQFAPSLPTGDGSNLSCTIYETRGFLWGAQVEVGSFATSYIKTSGAPAGTVRSADNASITGENFSSWYRQDEGSLYVETSTFDTRSGNSRITFSDGTNNNRIFTANGDYALFVQTNGGIKVEINSNLLINQYVKKAIGLKENDFAVSVNGVDPIIDSSGTLPLVDKVGFWNINQSGTQINGHIKKLAYYPQRLTNEQLQNLTK